MTIARYRRALEITRAHADIHAWLTDGLAALEDGLDLAEALQLSGVRAPQRRNLLLREAAELIAPRRRPWRQARELAAAIQKAMATRDQSQASRMLRDAELYRRVPRTQRGLYNILKNEK